MAIQTKTLAVLVSEIKKEARVAGSDNLDGFIKDTINELLLEAVERTRYFEMLLVGQPITLVEASGAYDLPDDFSKMRAMRYTIGTAGVPFPLYQKGAYIATTSGGNPRFWEIAGTQFIITPETNIREDDTLVIDYYKYPSELALDGDIFPIPRLIGPIKLKAIYRTVLYNRELNVATILRGDSSDQEARSSEPLSHE